MMKPCGTMSHRVFDVIGNCSNKRSKLVPLERDSVQFPRLDRGKQRQRSCFVLQKGIIDSFSISEKQTKINCKYGILLCIYLHRKAPYAILPQYNELSML